MFCALGSGGKGKGYLTAKDMRPFAERMVFTGSDQKWEPKFELLRHDRESTGRFGLDAFISLVNDPLDDACFCSGKGLRKLSPPRSQPTQPAPSKAPASVAKRTAAACGVAVAAVQARYMS